MLNSITSCQCLTADIRNRYVKQTICLFTASDGKRKIVLDTINRQAHTKLDLHRRKPSNTCFNYCTFIHPVFCLTTGPKPPPKRCLHIVRCRASSFKWEYPLLSLRSSSISTFAKKSRLGNQLLSTQFIKARNFRKCGYPFFFKAFSQNCEKQLLASSCLSVRPSAWNSSAPPDGFA